MQTLDCVQTHHEQFAAKLIFLPPKKFIDYVYSFLGMILTLPPHQIL